MDLLVDLLALVDVVAHVGEVGFLFAPVDERTVPQDLFFGLEAQVGKLLVVLAAHFAVDVQEAREQVGCPGAIWPVGSTEFTSFSMSASSTGKSRTRNFLGKSLNQKWPVASVPAGLRA